MKVKILEVLLFLAGMELPEYESPKRKLPKAQVQVVKDAHAYLATHMNEHITISELARRFQVSQTQLKDSFRLVYGTSVQLCWAKKQKRGINMNGWRETSTRLCILQ